MPVQYPLWNDNEIDILKKIANNTALLADAEAGDVASIIAGAGISVDSPTGVVTITNTGVLSVTGTANEITASPTTGAVIVSLPNALTFTGKTITGGTFTGGTYSGSSFTDSGLTATRVVFAGVGGLLSDDADMTFATDTLTVTKAIHPTSLLVGNGTAANLLSALTVYDTGTSLPRGISNVQVSSGTDSANFSGYKARGAPGALTTIVTGDLLANVRAWGYDGSNYINSGSLRWTSEGTIAATRVPSKLELLVSTDVAPSVLTVAASFSGSSGNSFVALGTNQSNSFTPSGTGLARFVDPTNSLQFLAASYSSGGHIAWTRNDSSLFSGFDLIARNTSGGAVTALSFSTTQAATFANAVTVPTLLNLTSTAGDNTGGLVFGADTVLFRSQAGTLRGQGSQNSIDIRLRNSLATGSTTFSAINDGADSSTDGTMFGTGGTNAAAAIQDYGFIQSGSNLQGIRILTNASTVAVTVNNSQNVTFVGKIALSGETVSTSTGCVFPTGTTALSSLRIPHGAAPSAPVNGDMWTTTAGLFIRINGATVGPLS